MAHSIYVASAEGHTAKSVVALGLLETLLKNYKTVAVFRSILASTDTPDPIFELLHLASGSSIPITDCLGVTYEEIHQSSEGALESVLDRYKKVEAQAEAVLILGSDFTDVFSPTEFLFNAKIATTLGAPMAMVLNGRASDSTNDNMGQAGARDATEIAAVAELAMQEAEKAFTSVIAAVVNRVEPELLQEVQAEVAKIMGPEVPVSVIPEDPHLLAPRMSQIVSAVGGQLAFGDKANLDVEVMDLVVAAMTPEHVLQRITEDAVVVLPADRTEVLLALLMADASTTFPKLAGIVLNGGFEISQTIQQLINGFHPTLPVVLADGTSFDMTVKIRGTRGMINGQDQDKVARALKLATDNLDLIGLVAEIAAFKQKTITPLAFEHRLIERARAAKQIIVLPEGEDDRILQAAAQVLERDIANLIILGEPSEILARAKQLDVDISKAQIMPIEGSEHFDACVAEYVKLRSHKGVTTEHARETMKDSSYFGTMLVQLGLADGMVSGAVNTTAHTVKPAFEFVRTKPGVSVVSSVFLMALADRVLVYGDCAVIPEPTSEQLADIAISSAATAKNFGIEPRVAMLSYSTGTSGTGAEVEKVRLATELAKSRAPELSIEGPIQYDAAVDAAVAKAKMPQSSVAGKATVFVFPDLNTGNNTYKAVQRTAGAVAIGPILQGLNKPVNDLSRGALVKDIVNTIAITAIQAGQE